MIGASANLGSQRFTLREAVHRLAYLVMTLWTLLSLERWLWATQERHVVAESLYLQRVAAASAAFVALFWLGGRLLAMGSGLRARLVSVLLSLLVAGRFWLLAAPIARGEGAQDLIWRPGLLEPTFALAGFVLTLTVWCLERLRSSAWAVPLQATLAGALTLLALHFARGDGAIASAALVIAALTLSDGLARVLASARAAGACLTQAITGLTALLLVWSLADPARVALGRQAILIDQRVPAALRVLWPGSDLPAQRAVRLSLTGLTPQSCAALPKRVSPAPLRSDPARRRNVLLVSIDALRRDALGASIDGKRVAPHLFAFSQQAQLLQRATTSYAATLFSVTGALTGLAASRIALLPTPPRTLFSTARPAIAQQLAVLSSAGTFFERPAFRGYALQDVNVKYERSAHAQTTTLLRFVESARETGQPFMAWVHFAEAHAPYRGHKAFHYGPSERERYLAEVSYIDAQFGRLIETLTKSGALADTLIIVFADHGEALGERGHHGHHLFLNRWVAEVPLMIHVPTGESVNGEVHAETSDIAPTVLHFLGLEAPHAMTGRSLLDPQLDANRALVAEAFSTGTSLGEFARKPVHTQAELARRMAMVQHGFGRYLPNVSITEGNHRLIVNRGTGVTALYDTEADPEERQDLSLERPARRQQLLDKLAAWHREQSLAVYCATLAVGDKGKP